MSVSSGRLKQIIKEEVSKAVSEAMTPEERLLRRREQARASRQRAQDAAYEREMARRAKHDIQQLGVVAGPRAELKPGGPLPGMMSYDSDIFRKAYIDRAFQSESGIYTPEDLLAAVQEGRAKVWSAGMIGGAQPPSMTVVPPDAHAYFDERTGKQGYPYVYTRNVKSPEGSYTYELEVVIQRGIGYGGFGPSTFSNDPNSRLRPDLLRGRVDEIVPIDLEGGQKGEVVDATDGGESGEGEMGGGSEPLMERLNILAGTRRR